MEKNKTLIIFTDSGDTIIDEGSQEYALQEPEIVIRADFIENAGEVLKQLHDKGYTIALVADGEEASFQNVYGKNGLRSCFDAWVVSETVGKQKPEAIMFQTAMEQLGLGEEDKKRIVMIGNNLKKDIAGANRFGITSIWLDWSPRYYRTIEEEDWRPDYTVHHPSELPALLEELNRKLEERT
ncbi:HAD family hydrolase [Eisenbergiella sp.]